MDGTINKSKQIYKHLIVSGCSFSAGGVGGFPLEGCSYIIDPDYDVVEPNCYAGFLARKLNITSLVNTASGSHGNILVSETVLDLLDQYDYSNADTLVVFNLSEPSRLDISCEHGPESSKWISWTKDILSYAYHPRIVNPAMEQQTSAKVNELMSTLQSKRFNFYFMMMDDYTNDEYLGPVINKFKDHLITFDPGPSMLQFASATGKTKSVTDAHPNLQAHEIFADTIYDKL